MGALSAVPIVVGLWPVLLTGVYAMIQRKEKIANQETEQAVVAAVSRPKLRQRPSAKERNRPKLKQKEIENAVRKALEEAAKTEAEDTEHSNLKKRIRSQPRRTPDV